MLNEVMQKATEAKLLLIALTTCVLGSLLVARAIIQRAKKNPSEKTLLEDNNE